MANVNLNALIDGVSGKVGKKLVMRQRGGRTFLASAPEAGRELSEKQKLQRERFRKAARYGKASMALPDVKAEYEATVKGDAFMTAYSAAVADYLKAPEVEIIDLGDYHGQPGDVIRIALATPYKLQSMKVSIQQANGTVIEAGDALASDNRQEWRYTATANIPVLSGFKVVITVTNRPGNVTVREEVLE